MHLIIASTPEAQWSELLPLFESAGYRVAEMAVVERWHQALAEAPAAAAGQERDPSALDPAADVLGEVFDETQASLILPAPDPVPVERLEAVLDRFEGTGVIGFHDRPEPELVAALTAGEDPAGRLEPWIASASALKDLYRRNQSRTRLFQLGQAAANPQSLARACNKVFGLRLDASHSPSSRDSAEAAPEAPLYQALAAAAVLTNPRAVEMLNVLEACTEPFTPGDSTGQAIDWPSALQALRSLEDSASQPRGVDEATYNEIKEENELLLTQLHYVQEELESYYLHAKQLEQGKESADSKAQEALRAERDRLKQQLEQKRSERGRLKQRLEQKKADLAAVRNSSSWRISRPLRAIRHAIAGRPDAKGSES